MSVFGDMATDVLADLAGNAAQTVLYRTAPTGTWTAFAADVQVLLVPMDPIPTAEDQSRHMQLAPQFASLRISLGGPLLNAGYGGAQVKDQNGVEWGVVSVAYRVSHTQYTCRRAGVVDAGPVAGRV